MDVKPVLFLASLIASISCAAVENKNHNSTTKSVCIKIVYNGSNNLIAAANVSANISSIIDFKNNINVLLNGTSKSGVIIDLSSKKLLQLSNNILLWDAKNSVQEYINSIKSLSVLLKAAQKTGKEIDGNNTVITSLIAKLGFSLKVFNTNQHLQELTEINKLLNGTLKGLYDGSGTISFNGGLQRLDLVELGLGKLFSNVSGGLQGALNGSKVHVKEILSGSNALEILLSVLKQIGTKNNLEKILGAVLNNKVKLFEVLHLLAGGQTTGVDGVINLITAPNPDNLLDNALSLWESGLLSTISNDLVKLNQRLTAVIKEQQTKYGAKSLREFQTILSSLVNGSVVKVIKSDNFSNGLDLAVKVLISLGNVNQSIPQLFQTVIKLINSTDGAKVVPGINESSLNNLQSVLKNNLTEILNGGGNVSAQIAKLPIIGDIWSHISQSAGGSVNLQNILNATSLQGILTNLTSISNVTGEIQNGIGAIVNSSLSNSGLGGATGGIIGQLASFGSSSGLKETIDKGSVLNSTSTEVFGVTGASTVSGSIEATTKGSVTSFSTSPSLVTGASTNSTASYSVSGSTEANSTASFASTERSGVTTASTSNITDDFDSRKASTKGSVPISTANFSTTDASGVTGTTANVSGSGLTKTTIKGSVPISTFNSSTTDASGVTGTTANDSVSGSGSTKTTTNVSVPSSTTSSTSIETSGVTNASTSSIADDFVSDSDTRKGSIKGSVPISTTNSSSIDASGVTASSSGSTNTTTKGSVPSSTANYSTIDASKVSTGSVVNNSTSSSDKDDDSAGDFGSEERSGSATRGDTSKSGFESRHK